MCSIQKFTRTNQSINLAINKFQETTNSSIQILICSIYSIALCFPFCLSLVNLSPLYSVILLVFGYVPVIFGIWFPLSAFIIILYSTYIIDVTDVNVFNFYKKYSYAPVKSFVLLSFFLLIGVSFILLDLITAVIVSYIILTSIISFILLQKFDGTLILRKMLFERLKTEQPLHVRWAAANGMFVVNGRERAFDPGQIKDELLFYENHPKLLSTWESIRLKSIVQKKINVLVNKDVSLTELKNIYSPINVIERYRSVINNSLISIPVSSYLKSLFKYSLGLIHFIVQTLIYIGLFVGAAYFLRNNNPEISRILISQILPS